MMPAEGICCLCGRSATPTDPITREHVPPKQFYPKSIRDGLNLWVLPTHQSCNNKDKADEEYFYHALYPLVANANPHIASVILDDLKRRAGKPQTRNLLRKVLSTFRLRSPQGLHLPPGIVHVNANKFRIQQVAIKIARCLFFRDHKRFMPYVNCIDIRLCEREQDVPALYKLSWEVSKVNINELIPSEPGGMAVVESVRMGLPLAAYRQVFDYRSAFLEIDGLHFYSLRFWEAFMFCIAFKEPDGSVFHSGKPGSPGNIAANGNRAGK